MSLITRFAPSPTGYLHLGHAFAAKQAFDFAAAQDGTCLLRIEDIDHTRCKPAYTDAIYEDLAWLGFQWPAPIRIQSDYRSDYAAVTERLQTMGVIYRCFKSRKELPEGVYHGLPDPEEAEKLKRGEPYSLRLSVSASMERLRVQGHDRLIYEETGIGTGPSGFNIDTVSDPIIVRKDIGTSYLIACTHDDALQGVTHVVRGVDIDHLTGLQVLLKKLLGYPTPLYHHHVLITRPDGKKLAKRNRDITLRALRASGCTARDVFAMAEP